MEQIVLEDRFIIIQNKQLGYVRVALGSRWSLVVVFYKTGTTVTGVPGFSVIQ